MSKGSGESSAPGILQNPADVKAQGARTPAAPFYKVTFDAALRPTVTALNADTLWDTAQGGLDKTKPFIVVNPGNSPLNTRHFATATSDDIEDTVTKVEIKMFEKGVRKYVPEGEARQYLMTVNETGTTFDTKGAPNFTGIKQNLALIKQHNAKPDGFTTPYATEQARMIYGPLITEKGIAPDGSGVALPDDQIIANLSNARSYNASFGSVTANCHNNALVKMMQDLHIAPKTVKAGVESMRRFDAPNMARPGAGLFASTVIFEGANDKLAEEYGARVPPVPQNHNNVSICPIGGDAHRIKVYQTLPEEVYHPGKKPTPAEKNQEERFLRSLPPALGVAITNGVESIRSNILGYAGLGSFRFKDGNVHNAPHLTCEPTPGNEVPGRDPDLLYKLMADMLTRDNPKDVSHYFDQQRIRNTNALDLSAVPIPDSLKSEAKKIGAAVFTKQPVDLTSKPRSEQVLVTNISQTPQRSREI